MKIEYKNSFCIDSVLQAVMEKNKKEEKRSKKPKTKKEKTDIGDIDEDGNILIDINLDDQEDDDFILDSGVDTDVTSMVDYLEQK